MAVAKNSLNTSGLPDSVACPVRSAWREVRIMGGAFLLLLMSSIAGSALGQATPGTITSVTDLGAKGDGKTDDAAAIQAAIDRVSRTGGRVLIPKAASPYLIGRSLVIAADNVALCGPGATLRLADGAGSGKIVDCIEIRGTEAQILGGHVTSDQENDRAG